jgi:hypothetical protein
MIEERVIPQCDRDFETGQLVEALIEQQHVIATAPGVLKRLLARSRSRNFISPLREDRLQRSAHPFVRASDQNYKIP